MTDHRICDYEGSTYETDFWQDKGREYEDRVERIAIRRLMPLKGERLLEVGAGFGRLTSLFRDYKQVVLLDYSRSNLESARQRLGDDGFLYVAADLYRMPFAPGLFDGATLIRVLHHVEDPLAALRGLRLVMRRGGVFLLEFANKRNLKAILRWLLRRQVWNPLAPEPVEFVELNYDFHPRTIRQQLTAASFMPGRTLAVSHFRLDFLKRHVPIGILVFLDSLAQFSGAVWPLTPSVFVRNKAVGEDTSAPAGAFWRCPACGGYDLGGRVDRLVCRDCHTKWGIVNGVYDFKQPRDQ